MKHNHTAENYIETTYERCVGMVCKSEAHGEIKRSEICRCGFERAVNIRVSKRWKKTHKEYGSWVRPRQT